MSQMKKRLMILIVCAAALFALALPVSNLIVGLPQSKTMAAIKAARPQDGAVIDILGPKCANCHTQDYILPFYANFPIAKGIITADIELGLDFYDMAPQFAQSGPAVGEVDLAKIEYVIDKGLMPPLRYVALHWDGGLSADEKEVIADWIHETRITHYVPDGVDADTGVSGVYPLPAEHGQPEAKVAFGEKLFNDTRLSKDHTLSCASCHDLGKGGTDQEAVATGVGDAKGPINSPTVFNARYNLTQFWDGRAADLQEQAEGPVENPIEMAADWNVVVETLNADEELTAAFTKEFPQGLNKDTVTSAIAIFESTLITPNSPFDKYLAGDESALDAKALKGWGHFQDLGCAMCHVGVAMGGQSFEKVGRYGDYFAERGGELTETDQGRFNHTKNEADKFFFKVPLLRNIELTFPYFHDASAKTLEEAVDVMIRLQMGEKATAARIEELVAFLKALTGEYQGRSLAAKTP